MPIRPSGKKLELIKEKNKKFLFKAKWNQVGTIRFEFDKNDPKKKSVKTLVILFPLQSYHSVYI